jgi:hypothetical protein
MLFAAHGVRVEGADGERVSMCISEARNCYRTMLAAAPAVPAASGEPAAQDKQDAERYRWLRDQAVHFGHDDGSPAPWIVLGTRAEDAAPCQGVELDEAVDAGRLAVAMVEVAAGTTGGASHG